MILLHSTGSERGTHRPQASSDNTHKVKCRPPNQLAPLACLLALAVLAGCETPSDPDHCTVTGVIVSVETPAGDTLGQVARPFACTPREDPGCVCMDADA